MTLKEMKFFKKLNRNIYIGIFCIAAIFFWYNAGHKSIDNSDNILDVSVSSNVTSDTVGIKADEKELVASDGSSDDAVDNKADEVAETEEEQTVVNPLYKGMFIVNVENSLNIRKEASENSEIVGKLYSGSGGDVIENGEEWTKIKSGSVEGYVKTEYIILGTQSTSEIEDAIVSIATVNTEKLKVRAGESTDSDVISMVAKGEELTCTSTATSDEWIGVEVDGKNGYVSADYVVVTQKLKSAVSIEEERAKQAAAEAAAQAEAEAQAAVQAETQIEAQAEKTVQETTQAENVAAVQATSESATKSTENQTNNSTTKASSTTVKSKSTSATTDESYLLACLVHCEAGSEPYEGKLAVANVVLNRLRSGWGSSISDVIYASGQFPPASNGTLESVIASGPNADSTKAANAALSGTNNVSGYYHFCGAGAIDYDRLDNYVVIGNHVFY